MQTSPPPFRCVRAATALAVIASLVLSPVAWACGGTRVPPTCGRSIFLAKFCPGTVVVPPAGPITVPIGVLPFLIWDKKTKGCAQPISAELELTLICTPLGGAPLPPIGPFTFPMPKPKNPGPQPLAGPVPFVIPAGLITVPPPHVCTVMGTYKVTFGPGIGTGLLAGSGDTTVCLVEPPSNRPDVPRLDMQYLPLDKKGQDHFQTCRRGDQATFHYLITNNDPVLDVTLDVTGGSNQVAGLPDGFTPGNDGPNFAANVFAISAPSGDDFPIAFAGSVVVGDLIPLPAHPYIQPPLTQTLPPLGPGQSTIISVVSRSYGMCADGSCSENTVKVEGTFTGGDPAVGCASSALLVGSPRGKSSLCEFTDDIKVGPKADTRWTPCRFGDALGDFPDSNTHYAGNLDPNVLVQPSLQQHVNLLTGAPLARKFSQPYANKSSDYVRIDQPTTQCHYDVFGQYDPAFIGIYNHVEITGLDQLPSGSKGKVVVPLVVPDPPFAIDSFFDIFVDIPGDNVQVVIDPMGTAQTIFNGPIKDFNKGKFQGAKLDKTTSRTINKFGGLGLPVISADPLGLTRAFDGSGGASVVQPLLSGGTSSFFFKWRAQLAGKGVKAINTRGNQSTPVVLLDQTRNKTPNSTGELSVLNIHVSGAVNTPLQVPIITRVLPNFCLHDDTDPNNEVAFNSETGDYIFNSAMGNNLMGRGKVKFKRSILSLDDKSKDGSSIHLEIDFETQIGFADPILLGIAGTPLLDTAAFSTCP